MDPPARGPASTRGRRRYSRGRADAVRRMPESPRRSSIQSRSRKDDNSSSGANDLEILLPTNEDDAVDAKRQIELIFRTPACWRSESDQTHLLYLLQRFPSLAALNFDWDYNLFWRHGSEWSSPLCFLLASGANLETIQAVYYLCPDALSRPQGVHCDLPLHFACRFGVANDVLVFLIQKFPYAVMVSNSMDMLPIHCALGKKDVFPYGRFHHASLETVMTLLELYPQSLLKEERETFYTPLQIAFSHGYSFEVIDYIISKMPSKMEGFKLKAGCYHNKLFSVDFDLAEAALVSKMLPRLQRLHCEPTQWKVAGWLQLLTCLQKNRSIVHFNALNLPRSFFLEEEGLCAISSLLQYNSTLEHFGLSLQAAGENDDTTESAFLGCLGSGLEKNHSLQSMELGNISVSCGDLNRLLFSKHAPRSLKMTNLALLLGPSESAQLSHHANKVEQLMISCSFVPSRPEATSCDFPAFLSGLAALPRLSELTLDALQQPNPLDVTNPLISILQNPSLTRLKLRGLDAGIQPVCESLRSNSSLRRLDFPQLLMTKENRRQLAEILENHNARIMLVTFPPRCNKQKRADEATRKIQYLTSLNKFGRCHLRESNTTKAFVVKLLQDVATQSTELRPIKRFSIQFGLLRESPSLWCQSAHAEMRYPCRKRPRIV